MTCTTAHPSTNFNQPFVRKLQSGLQTSPLILKVLQTSRVLVKVLPLRVEPLLVPSEPRLDDVELLLQCAEVLGDPLHILRIGCMPGRLSVIEDLLQIGQLRIQGFAASLVQISL